MSDSAKLVGGLLRLPRRASHRRPKGDWLFRGARPRLSDIDGRADVPMVALGAITAALTGEGARGGLHLITGRPGSGRSALLLRLGRNLASAGRLVYLYVPALQGDTLDRLLAESKRHSPTYLLIDDIDLCPEAETILYEIAQAGADVVVVGTATAEAEADDDRDGPALLRPATLTDHGVRHPLQVQLGDVRVLAAAMRIVPPPQLSDESGAAGLTMLSAVESLREVSQPGQDWKQQALGEVGRDEALLGLVLAGLAELALPKEVLTRSADGGRVEAWIKSGLAGGDDALVYPPHSALCREFLQELQPAASQMQAALTRLLDHAAGPGAIFAPRLLSRLAMVAETAEIAREEIARRGGVQAASAAENPESAAWRIARQVAGLASVEAAGPGSTPPDLARLMRASFVAGELDTALALADSLAEDRWYHTFGPYNVSLLHAWLGNWGSARGAAPPADSRLPQISFLLGLLHEQQQDYDAAIASYKAAAEDVTLAGAAVRHLGSVHLKIGAPRTALRLFEAALSQSPTRASLYGGVAVAHLQLGATEAARTQAERAIRAGVPPGPARRAIAQAFSEVRAYGHAVAELDRCLADDPSDVEAWRDLAEATHRAGDFARTEEALLQVLAAVPDDLAARLQIARCQKDQGHAVTAWGMLGALDDTRERTVEGSLLTAEVAGLVCEPLEQHRAAEAALALGEDSGWALFWLAHSQAAMGKEAGVSFTSAATALRRNASDDLPPRERARVWEAIVVAATYLRDGDAARNAAAQARREAQLCAATATTIDCVVAGRAVSAGAFLQQIEDILEHGLEATLPRLTPAITCEAAPAPEAEPELVAEPMVEAVAEPEPELVPEPMVEAAPEPEPELAAEPMVEAALEPEPELIVEPMVEAALEPEPELIAEPMVEAALEPEPELVPEPMVEAAPEPEPEPEPIAEPVRQVLTLVLSPSEAALLGAGDRRQFAAMLHYDDGGTEDVTEEAAWSWTGDERAATLSEPGLLIAGEGFGAGRVAATYEQWTAASPDIRVRNVTALVLSPPEVVSLSAGEMIQFAATLRYNDGTTENVTEQATWAWSGEEHSGAISQAGLFTAGGGSGSGAVTVSWEGLTAASAPLTVRNVEALVLSPAGEGPLAAGEAIQFAASLQYNDGATEDVTERATWAWSGDADAGHVSAAGVLVAGEGFGIGRVAATYEQWTAASEDIAVRNAAALALSPVEAAVLCADQTIQFAATLRYNDGTAEDVTEQATWTWSGGEQAGTISATGLFVAGEGFGAGAVTAGHEQWAVASADIAVRNVSGLVLSPLEAATLSVGQAIQFAATLSYNDGVVRDVSSEVDWTWTGSPETGAVSGSGLFIAGEGSGSGEIAARYEGLSVASAPLTVRQVVGLILSPDEPAILSAGQRLQLQAVLQYSDGTTQDVTEQSAWSWDAGPDAGAVDASGLFVGGEGFGVGVLTATCEGVSDHSAAITVRNPVALHLAPLEPALLSDGDQVQFAATLRHNDDTLEDVTEQATWAWTGDVGAASVSQDGVLTAGEGFGAGQVTVRHHQFTAESEGIRVRNVEALVLSPVGETPLAAGETIQFAAILRYNDGTTEDVTEAATWAWTGEERAGTVSPTGLFTAGDAYGTGHVSVSYDQWTGASEGIRVRNVEALVLSPVGETPLAAGETVQFVATLQYNDGATEDVTEQAIWTWSGEADAGTISATGLFTAGDAYGTGHVSVSYDQWSAESEDITVRNVAALVLSPTGVASLAAGETVQFVATLQYNDGATEDMTERAAWAWTGDEAAGAISATGLFTAGEGFGAGHVSVSCDQWSAESEDITVRTVEALMLSPREAVALSAGETTQFAAILQYNDGTTEYVTERAVWAWTGEEDAAAISEPGLLNAGAGHGTGQVTASYDRWIAASEDIVIRTVAALVLSPTRDTRLSAGETAQFAAMLRYNDGALEEVTEAATWAWTGDEDAGAVSDTGVLVAGEGYGTGRVTASYDQWIAASEDIAVRNVAALVLSPTGVASLSAGETIQFAATLRYNDGSGQDVTERVAWAWSGDEHAAAISESGLLTAGAGFGTGRVTVSYDDWNAASEDITVRTVAALALSPAAVASLAAGETIQFVAILQYNDGATEDITERVAWAWTGDEDAGAVSDTGVLVAGEGYGTGRVTASYDQWTAASEDIVVRNVEALVLSPVAAAILSADETIQFAATLRYNDGAGEDVTERVAWAWSGAESAGTISPAGLFTAGGGSGSGAVTVSWEGLTGSSALLTVRHTEGLALSPAEPAVLGAGQHLQFQAVMRYSDGETQVMTEQATWAWTGDEEAGAVSETGLFTAGVGFGSGVVTVSCEGLTAASAPLTVRNVAGLVLSPAEAASLAAGETIQFVAILQYNDGATEDITERVAWAWTGDEDAGAVSDTGVLVAGEGYGTGRVTASYDQWTTESEDITVRNVAALVLSPAVDTSLSAGEAIQFTATVRYTDGGTADVTGQATWTWSGEAEAGAVAAGLFVAGEGYGEGHVEAVWGSWRATTAAVMVATSDNLAVLPSAAMRLQTGETQQFSAAARSADGDWRHVPEGVTWSWTGPDGSGTISAAGVFTAGSQPGDGTVAATYAGRRERSGAIMVREAQLVVLPAEPVVLCAGQTVQLRAVLRHASGAEEELFEGVTWRWAGDEAAGTLSPDGVFTAGEVCATGTLVAMFDGQEASSETVEISNIALLVVMPSEMLYLGPGETQRFSASLRYTDGTLGDATGKATWSWTGALDSGSITPQGLLTAGPAWGEGAVVASYAGHDDQSGRIQVRSLVRLTLSPDGDGVMSGGDSRQFSVIAEYSDGYFEDVTAQTSWAWSGPDVGGRISYRGLLTTVDGWSGTVTVTATYKDQTVSSGKLEVRRPIALLLRPGEELVLDPGETQQFRLLLEYELGKPVRQSVLAGLFHRDPGIRKGNLVEDVTAQAEWQWAGDPQAGSILETGLFTAGHAGDVAYVTASYMDRRVSSNHVTVKAAAGEIPSEPAADRALIRERLARVVSERQEETSDTPSKR